jgi:hypothetical protein
MAKRHELGISRPERKFTFETIMEKKYKLL